MCLCVAPTVRTHTNGRMFETCPHALMCKDVKSHPQSYHPKETAVTIFIIRHSISQPLLILWLKPETLFLPSLLKESYVVSNFRPKIRIFLKSSLSLGVEESSLLSAPEPSAQTSDGLELLTYCLLLPWPIKSPLPLPFFPFLIHP